jgi:NAD(P)-dependent dehydrogenase (short-subunit alcohol dehydrogenase family)
MMWEEMRFTNKKVLVTGASRGIGASISGAFRNEGAFVIGTQTQHNPSSAGENCHEWLVADFADESQILQCVDFIKSNDIDILINNAGFNINKSFADIDLNVFKEIQQVNLLAPFLLSQAAVVGMEKKGWGRIVNISSIFGKISKAGRAAYSASKFGLDGLTVSLSAEYSSKGIMANCVAPGFFDTSLTRKMLTVEEIGELISNVPIARLGVVGEIANLVLWLSSAENTFTTGQNIAIDGGFGRV